jgi:hypothetical protein
MMWIDLADPSPYKEAPRDGIAAIPPPVIPIHMSRGKTIAYMCIAAFTCAIAAATTPFASFNTQTDINTVTVTLDLWSLCGHYSPPQSMPALLPWMGAGGSCLPITSSTIACDQSRRDIIAARVLYLFCAALLLAHLIVALVDVAGLGTDAVVKKIHLGLGAAALFGSLTCWIMVLRFPLVPTCGNPNPISAEADFTFGPSAFFMLIVTILSTVNILVATCVPRLTPPSPPPSPNHHHHHCHPHHHGHHHHNHGHGHHHHHHHHHGGSNGYVSLFSNQNAATLLVARPKHVAFACLTLMAFALSIAGLATRIGSWTPPATPFITSDTSATMSPWFVCTSFNMSASMHESCWYVADPQAPSVCGTYNRIGRSTQVFYAWTCITLLITIVVSVANYIGLLPNARTVRTCLAFKSFALSVIAGSLALAMVSQSFCDDQSGRVPKATEQPGFTWGPSGFLLMAAAAIAIAMTILSAAIDDATEEAEALLLS